MPFADLACLKSSKSLYLFTTLLQNWATAILRSLGIFRLYIKNPTSSLQRLPQEGTSLDAFPFEMNTEQSDVMPFTSIGSTFYLLFPLH